MLSPHPVTAPIHIVSDFHSTVEVVDHESDLNFDGLSPRSFGTGGRSAFSPSRLSVSSLSCSRSPLRDASNIDHSIYRVKERSWSKGSNGLRSGTTTATPTRHSSPAHAPTKSKAPGSLKPIITRPRGRSGSKRKVNLSLSIKGHSRPRPITTYLAGTIPSNLPRVGVEVCRRWVTNTPPSAWPAIRTSDPTTIAYTTVRETLPRVLENAIKDAEYRLEDLVAEQSLLFLHNQHHLTILALDDSEDVLRLEDQTKDLERCIERMKLLLQELYSNSALRPIEDDGERDVQSWNSKLRRIIRAEGGCTFLDGPILFVEGYAYRRVRECFALSTYWRDYDVFGHIKRQDFIRSAEAVLELSRRFAEPFYAGDCVLPWENLEKTREAFSELLSLCTFDATRDFENILEMTEDELRATSHIPSERLQPISLDNEARLWNHISKDYAAGGSRVDFVLNNAGLELYCDLALADFMIQTGLADRVHFHGKLFPWFVSDATKKDWDWLLESLCDKNLFPYPTSPERDSLQKLGERWKTYEKEGEFVFETHPFWCTGLSYWDFPTHAPDLFSRLSTSSLVIFKGDLNYLRLTAGRITPTDTPFRLAVGPMVTHPRSPALCSLRMVQSGKVVSQDQKYDPDLVQYCYVT